MAEILDTQVRFVMDYITGFLISLQLLQKEALERVLQDNRRQNEALRREFLRGDQQSQ